MLDEVRLIAILPTGTTVKELSVMAALAERGGATSVQVRMKGVPASQILAACERLREELTIPVYVNDRADIARVAGIAGVHIGADDLSPRDVRLVVPRPCRVGISVGSEVEAAAAEGADVDYWSIGPFAATDTKSDAGPALGEAGFARLKSLAPSGMPVVAIGGVHAGNVEAAVRAGASGVAVIGALFGGPDVERATRALRGAIDHALG